MLFNKDSDVGDLYSVLLSKGWLKNESAPTAFPKIEQCELKMLKVLLLLQREQENDYIQSKNTEWMQKMASRKMR